MLTFIKTRKAKKLAKEILRSSRHLRHMREDLMAKEDLEHLEKCEQELKLSAKSGNIEEIADLSKKLADFVNKLAPDVSFPGVRENLEVIVVAVVVAMGFRSYFLQPFKIPTGSMQPTLNGIRYEESEPPEKPNIMDVQPLRFAKWFLTGDTYVEYRAMTNGVLLQANELGSSQEKAYVTVGGVPHKVPNSRYVTLNYAFGDEVEKGDVLWSGTRKAGDHVFVNRVAWNFRKPVRNEVSVFLTTSIPTLAQNIHYIKRLVAKPGETVSIKNNTLNINRKPIDDPRTESILRYPDETYHPYRVTMQGAGNGFRSKLMFTQDEFTLSGDQYFMLGDNTTSSLDSRYWGGAPEKNLVGPAWIVYWPFTKHWGRIR